MGLWSWLFPSFSPEERVERARAMIDEGKYEAARAELNGVEHPQADALYDEAFRRIQGDERTVAQRRQDRRRTRAEDKADQRRTVDLDRLKYRDAAAMLRVQVFVEDDITLMRGADLVSRPLAPGLCETLVLDVGAFETTVSAGQARGWNRTPEELLTVARRNVLADDGELVRSAIEKGGRLLGELTAGNGYFVAARVAADPALTRHALVAMPTRHALLRRELDTPCDVSALEGLCDVAVRLHADGSDTLSPNVFWCRDGTFERVPFRLEGERVVVDPPAGLLRP